MSDALGRVRNIVEVALQIKEAVDTVRKNKADCYEIGRRVSRLSAILSKMENLEMVKDQAMIQALENLEETLYRALKLVRACQSTRNIHLGATGYLTKELRQVNQVIMDQIAAANWITQDAGHLGAVESSSSSASNNDTRFGADGERKSDPACMEHFLNQSGFRMFSLSEMKAATNNFSEHNLIGRGGSATVYKHQNIVCFLGYCQETTYEKMLYKGRYVEAEITSMIVVEEYTPNGNLSDIIEGQCPQMDWSIIFQIIQGMAQGIAHLHWKNIIHMDLKPENILFDSNMNPKICDFEMCKIFDQEVTQEVTEELAGTLGYMAPEYIAQGVISAKNDVYSFGLLVLSTIRGMSRSGLLQHSIEWAWEVREAQSLKDLFDSASCGESQLQEVERRIHIGLLCTQDNPRERPTMPDVLRMLNSEERPAAPTPPSFIKR
uniref:Protein kinase domain-containing protein n=1 Tax=Setaria italica TaxID=4555 RepID=K3ZII6_SETIT